MTHSAVTCSQLHKSYRTGRCVTPVLRGIDLQVQPGKCVFLVGPSGSGKTTLLSIIGGVLRPDSGQLHLLGRCLDAMSASERSEFRLRRIGFIFQRFHLFERLTAAENIRVVCSLLGLPRRFARLRALELLSQVGLADRTGHKVMELSMGQRQRVAIARALVADPDLILADEPTASLDADSGMSAMRLLKDLCGQLNKTAIVVTHDERIRPLADCVLTMQDGRIAAGNTPPILPRTPNPEGRSLPRPGMLSPRQCVEV